MRSVRGLLRFLSNHLSKVVDFANPQFSIFTRLKSTERQIRKRHASESSNRCPDGLYDSMDVPVFTLDKRELKPVVFRFGLHALQENGFRWASV